MHPNHSEIGNIDMVSGLCRFAALACSTESLLKDGICIERYRLCDFRVRADESEVLSAGRCSRECSVVCTRCTF